MGSINSALVAAREQAGLTQAALAERLGRHRSAVNSRERGRADLSTGELERVAVATGCTMAVGPDGTWRVLPRDDPFNANPNRSAAYAAEQPGDGIPVFGSVGAGPPILSADEATEWFDLNRRWLQQIDGILQVRGDSMEPTLWDGDLVGLRVLDDGDDPKNGEVVAVWLPQTGEVQIKVWWGWRRIERKLYGQYLSTNILYEPLLYTAEEAVPRARVVGVLRLREIRIGSRGTVD